MTPKNKQTIVVTGAGGEIGMSIVKEFINDGNRVIACFRNINDDLLKVLSSRGLNQSENLVYLAANLAVDFEVKQLIKDIHSICSSVDVLVNNAGVASGGSFLMTRTKDVEDTFKINVISGMKLSQGLAKNMMRSGRGNIIFISSISGIEALSGTTSYAISKAALGHMSRIMAQELAIHGIRVNCVAPGIVESQMLAKNSKNFLEKMVIGSAQQRFCTSDEVASLVAFLASEKSKHINGQIIRIDGGRA
jgi:3-oxoacyl-[acyl-carrier protein] reductase